MGWEELLKITKGQDPTKTPGFGGISLSSPVQVLQLGLVRIHVDRVTNLEVATLADSLALILSGATVSPTEVSICFSPGQKFFFQISHSFL